MTDPRIVRVVAIDDYGPGVEPGTPGAKPISTRYFMGEQMETEVSAVEADAIRLSNTRIMRGASNGGEA